MATKSRSPRPRGFNKLKSRQTAWDGMRSEGAQSTLSKWVRTEGGKNQMFHRPGSNKK